MKRIVSISILSIGVVALIWIARHPRASQQFATVVAEQSSTEVPIAFRRRESAPQTALQGYRWIVGDRGTWAFNAGLSIGSADDADLSQVTEISGNLELEVVESTAAEIKLLAVLAEADCQRAGDSMPALSSLFSETACMVRLDPQGRALSRAYASSIAEDDRRLLELVFGWVGSMVVEARTQYVEPHDGDEGLSASYLRDADTVRKTRFCASTEPKSVAQEILSSQFKGRIGHLWLSELEGSENTRLAFNDQPFIHARVWVRLKELSAGRMHDSLSWWKSHIADLTITPSPTARSISQQLRQEMLTERWGNTPLNEMMDGFQPGAGMEHNVHALNQLRDWLLARGVEGASELLARIEDPTLDPEISGMMTHALATSEGDAARMAHLVILRTPNSFPSTVLNQALVSAGQVEQPSTQLIGAVSELLSTRDDPQSVVLLSAAAISRKSTAMAKVLADRILPDLATDTAAERVERSLLALSQAEIRDPGVVAAAKPWEQSPDPDIRIAALRYLYKVSENPARLAEQYKGDPDSRVRNLFDPSDPE